jgi:hypothetical protein
LRAQLEHVDPQKPIALFAHHALAPGADEGRLANADQVLELFANRNLKLVLSSQGLENRTEEHHGTIFISTVPCSTTADTPADKRGIRVISIDGAQMAHEFVPVPL